MLSAEVTPARMIARRAGPRAGFTLVELLVVIGVLALLLALIAPSVRGAVASARRAKCAANLHAIGQAFTARINDQVTRDLSPFTALAWTGMLLPYLERNMNVLRCPEDMDFDGSLPGAARFRIHFYGPSGMELDYYTELDGPYVAKMSDTQYQACRAAGYLRSGRRLSNYGQYRGYVEDDRPNVYWFCVEEVHAGYEYVEPGNSAHDFEDIRMRVTDNGEGTVELYFELGSGNIHAGILYVKDNEPLVFIGLGYPRASFHMGPIYGVTDSSYGFNAAVRPLAGGPTSMLALDYGRIVARTDDVWADDATSGGAPSFARHTGRINVLFGDEHVEVMSPREIDPVDPSAVVDYWTGPDHP